MNSFARYLAIGLLVLLVSGLAFAQETEDSYSLWLGGHYTDFSDYTQKVGEFNKGEDEAWPEFQINYLSRGGHGIFYLDGHFYDDENIYGRVRTVSGDTWKGTFTYRSLVKWEGADLMDNLQAREWLSGSFGGKYVTHEQLTPDAEYKTHRQEILSDMEVLLSKKNNVKLMVSHRTILQKGHEEAQSVTHCFNCHITTQAAKVDKRTHHIEAGIQADVKDMTVGYKFGYRLFESAAPEVYAYYDAARHPVNGGSGAEFSPRQIYDDTSVALSPYPKTEKMSHKVRMKTDVGKGKLASSVTYYRAENKNTQLVSDGWSGAAKFTAPLSPRSRLIITASGARLWNDEVVVDLPIFRDGRSGYNGDFDYTRYSSLDRRNLSASAQLIHRLNLKMTLSAKAGYDQIKRYQYPVLDNDESTGKFYGEVKMNYTKGLKYSTRVKYRFESISNPFTSGRGLFESRGRGVLEPLGWPNQFVYYFQREDLRYQDITTEPTQVHAFEWQSNWKPQPDVTVTVGLKGSYDKNTDLDSLDVNHFALRPNLSLTYMPSGKATLTAGYTFNSVKSRGPVAVALFDG